MRRFLFITYAFPPMGGAGVQRPVKFVKYIGRHGWRPVVVTAANHSGPTRDASLSGDLPPDLLIERIKSLEPAVGQATVGGAGGDGATLRSLAGRLANNLLFPDRHVLWLATALGPTLAVARRQRVRAVYVSGPPFSSFFLAERVARKLNLPLLLDFRDEWSGYYSKGFQPGAHGAWDRLVSAQERRLVNRAAVVTAASPAYCQRFRFLYGGFDKYVWIPNGYDPDDFAGQRPGPLPRQAGRLHIVYAGTVFGVTSLEPLWRGLRLLPPGMRQHISVEICGRVTGGEVSEPRIPGLRVEVRGYLPHDQAIERMMRADALLLTLADLPGSERVIPGKIFEYAAAGRPLLAICPPGETAALVEAIGGTRVAPNKPQAVADVLAAWLNQPPPPRPAPPPEFDRSRLTMLLARALDKATER